MGQATPSVVSDPSQGNVLSMWYLKQACLAIAILILYAGRDPYVHIGWLDGIFCFEKHLWLLVSIYSSLLFLCFYLFICFLGSHLRPFRRPLIVKRSNCLFAWSKMITCFWDHKKYFLPSSVQYGTEENIFMFIFIIIIKLSFQLS